ncbi:dihydropteroate synthase [Celerinatantimonas diazotrophica]|uniref:Dihydropteroate synthase n=1 Tax=Celerinatantimonas diazotrophica TaxID=412034 RepID=A0A4R1K4L8_9GAMM|nr:dihydropteroate synthase [Celerinatantimonas diazotrophica]TCK58867.1 dihydropteroate synthase [Celerinatantimonas diazotrophica]CAG9297499.1 Dihydropteroate synthase [Celerinatantimonas diazotrophica]
MKLTIAGKVYHRPMVMGILNCTPDSFSDGGRYLAEDKAIEHARAMIKDGADIIDIGGESTRPGSAEVCIEEELNRTIGPIKAIKQELGCLVSIDTRHALVMTKACEAGADLINDINALNEPGAIDAAVQADVAVCLMHMQGQPETMQNSPCYNNILSEVINYLNNRAQIAIAAGVKPENIILDPGFGFGKNVEHNFSMLRHLEDFQTLGYPLLVGVSRKSMFGKLLNRAVDERLAASLAGACIAAMKGAAILRVHDVRETADVLKVTYHSMDHE